MRPIKTEATNFVYKLGGGTEDNDLPCHLTPLGCVSTWEFEPDDDPITLGDVPVSDVRVCVGVWGDFTTISRYLMVRIALREQVEPISTEPLWFEHHEHQMAIGVFPLTDEDRSRIAVDGALDIFIGAQPIPPISLWTARVGECERCGVQAIHPCPCGVQ